MIDWQICVPLLQDACQRIAAETHCKLRPVLSAQDICRTCVHAIFTGKPCLCEKVTVLVITTVRAIVSDRTPKAS